MYFVNVCVCVCIRMNVFEFLLVEQIFRHLKYADYVNDINVSRFSIRLNITEVPSCHATYIFSISLFLFVLSFFITV